MKSSFLLLLSTLWALAVVGQTTVSGKLIDEGTGEPLFGATVAIEGTTEGATTDLDGVFSFTTDKNPPFNLKISYVGFEERIVEFTGQGNLKVELKTSSTVLDVLEVNDFRISEKEKEAPTTVESMDLISIKETPAVSFYDGLGTLKGVDLTAASMGFKIVNTRGFNSTSPVRSLQIIDGVDNQAPGLNFSIGNFAGASELDVQKVELMVGANTALYGPNAFNGVISMTTKDPFVHQGITAMSKVGERELIETAMRAARAFKVFGKDYENLALKFNVSYMQANDWQADNIDTVFLTESSENNWGGYDAVNRYGDEVVVGSDGLTSQRLFPGLGRYHRTGYNEVDLVDYDTENLKLSGAMHYKFTEDIRLKLAYRYGNGTTVYQGDNRYSLKDLQIHQQIVELSKPDKFFVRAYNTFENAGKSYDAVFTAMLLQQSAKADPTWSQDYLNYYLQNIVPRVQSLDSFPQGLDWFAIPLGSGPNLAAYDKAQNIMDMNADSLLIWHGMARDFADSIGGSTGLGVRVPYFEPGTERFDSLFNDITSRLTFAEGGSGFYDRSALSHIQGQYTFDPKNSEGSEIVKVILGGNIRQYRPDSKGTIFVDTSGNVVRNVEGGLYTSIQKRLVETRLILTASGRLDKNQNFEPLFSPALSAVYKVNEKSTIRVSLSSAIRNPTLADQYLYYNTGRALLIGNILGYDSLVTLESFKNYNRTLNRDTLVYFNVAPVQPERVRTVEVGFKGVLLSNLFVDASYYYSWYNNFLGFKIGADITFDTLGLLLPGETQVYRVSANSPSVVNTQGVSVGFNYYFGKFYSLSGNYSWNVLAKSDTTDDIIPAYNTPEHKFNVSFSGRDINYKIGSLRLKNVGFNVTYKWIEGFLFEGSPQFTGIIPTYDMLDAQVSYSPKKLKTTFKIGASNILNRQNYHTYGGPQIGRMAYVSILVDLKREKSQPKAGLD